MKCPDCNAPMSRGIHIYQWECRHCGTTIGGRSMPRRFHPFHPDEWCDDCNGLGWDNANKDCPTCKNTGLKASARDIE